MLSYLHDEIKDDQLDGMLEIFWRNGRLLVEYKN
jgi:hypothetical protein